MKENVLLFVTPINLTISLTVTIAQLHCQSIPNHKATQES